jgi:hypothetical protein
VPVSADRPEPFDASRPHVARVYDYLLGGKDNFAADRAIGDKMLASIPAVQLGVRAQRDVLGRVVRYLVRDVGLRQLLDIEPPTVRDHPVLEMACAGVALKP